MVRVFITLNVKNYTIKTLSSSDTNFHWIVDYHTTFKATKTKPLTQMETFLTSGTFLAEIVDLHEYLHFSNFKITSSKIKISILFIV